MNILYIHQYFATPNGHTGTRNYEFARKWVSAGHKVRMLTTIAQLTSEEVSSAKGRIIKKFELDGIEVLAFNLPYNQKMAFVARSLSFILFFVLASLFILFTKKPDAVYASSTPLTVGIPALVGRWFRRIPFVFEVRDQWPEIPIELGIIKNSIFVKLLLWLEKVIYKQSSQIIALSPGMAEGISKVSGLDKNITVIPNSCDLDLFGIDIDRSHIRDKYNWNKKLVFLHAGAIGKVNSLQFVIDAAEKLRANKDILFVLIGQGNEKAAIEKRVAKLNLDNVQILQSIPKRTVPDVFAAADVALVVIGNFPIIEHNSANKFFDSLSAGKPIVLNYSGWQRKFIENNNAGFGCELCDIDEFIEKVLYFNLHREQLATMGQNSRRLAEEIFDRKKLAMQALDVISSTVNEVL
ncbi:MAG: glycosyltransferase family 4 protein [Planctomycetes bacterium]|nr:glycosyltransferase family 4 protein [Planctomycetota bacterium]MCK5472470.1 glycosyltransferase family 4 protein [Planctomycetota bacterium]